MKMKIRLNLCIKMMTHSTTICISITRKAIFWLVTVYNKNLSSLWNLTAEIEQVQDKL
jgi:hypothetical protein